jgi:hypothetical protein
MKKIVRRYPARVFLELNPSGGDHIVSYTGKYRNDIARVTPTSGIRPQFEIYNRPAQNDKTPNPHRKNFMRKQKCTKKKGRAISSRPK